MNEFSGQLTYKLFTFYNDNQQQAENYSFRPSNQNQNFKFFFLKNECKSNQVLKRIQFLFPHLKFISFFFCLFSDSALCKNIVCQRYQHCQLNENGQTQCVCSQQQQQSSDVCRTTNKQPGKMILKKF